MNPNTAVVHIADGVLHVQDTLSGKMDTETPDVIIAAVGNRTNDGLAQQLSENYHNLNIHIIGDAAAPRTILEAIREGRLAGRSI